MRFCAWDELKGGGGKWVIEDIEMEMNWESRAEVGSGDGLGWCC